MSKSPLDQGVPEMPAHMQESMPIDTNPALLSTTGKDLDINPDYSGLDTVLTPPEYFNHCGIKYDARTSSSLELNFESIETDTTKAILFNIFDENTGNILQEWFPKKLCSNLNEDAYSVRVWNVFANDKKKHLFPNFLKAEEVKARG
tara:strand:- start:460 stop:900 length:441 start_codon:yes stop_codon:yes gene_type:complete